MSHQPTDEAARRLAADLAAAQHGRFAIASRRGTIGEVGLDTAYEIGRDVERERIAAGWRPVGWKLGFTNQALWGQLGLDRPILARIYLETILTGDLDSAGLVQPRIEPEIVVGFGADVPCDSSTESIAAAIAWVAAGLEVVRCHFTGWEMTPAEAVADSGVHAALTVGPRAQVDPQSVGNLAAARCELMRDGVVVATGHGANVLGGPLNALRWLLSDLPGGIQKGEIVTTGTLTPALPIESGHIWEHRVVAGVALEPAVLRVR